MRARTARIAFQAVACGLSNVVVMGTHYMMNNVSLYVMMVAMLYVVVDLMVVTLFGEGWTY